MPKSAIHEETINFSPYAHLPTILKNCLLLNYFFVCLFERFQDSRRGRLSNLYDKSFVRYYFNLVFYMDNITDIHCFFLALFHDTNIKKTASFLVWKLVVIFLPVERVFFSGMLAYSKCYPNIKDILTLHLPR